MPELIEVTRAVNDKGSGESRPGAKIMVDICGAVIEPQEWSGYSRMKTVIRTTREASVRVEESYSSIKETLQSAGIRVLVVNPSDKVLIPVDWIHLIYLALQEYCTGRKCMECPLATDDECIKETFGRGDLPHA
jgi:hypothetical protein